MKNNFLFSVLSIVVLAFSASAVQAETLPSNTTFSASLTSSVSRDGEKVSLRILSGPLAGGTATGYVEEKSLAVVKITEITRSNGESVSLPPCKYYSTYSGDEQADRAQVEQDEWFGLLHGSTLHAGKTVHIRLVGSVSI